MTRQAELAVHKSVVVQRDPASAFALFTAGIATWWPLTTHSVGEVRAVSVAIEPRVGGRIIERTDDGAEHVWGTILAWDPPHAFTMTWHPGRDPSEAGEVEVRFEPHGAATHVSLEHRGFEGAGIDAPQRRESYDTGWSLVLSRYTAADAA